MKKPDFPSITEPIMDDLRRTHPPAPIPSPVPLEKPLPPAELDQDSGSGYNPDHTYPQT